MTLHRVIIKHGIFPFWNHWILKAYKYVYNKHMDILCDIEWNKGPYFTWFPFCFSMFLPAFPWYQQVVNSLTMNGCKDQRLSTLPCLPPSNFFSVSAYRLFMFLPLAHLGITPVNGTNRIQTRVGQDLNPVSYTTRIHMRMCPNLVTIYIGW